MLALHLSAFDRQAGGMWPGALRCGAGVAAGGGDNQRFLGRTFQSGVLPGFAV